MPIDAFVAYFNALAPLAEVILVDASDASIFAAIDARCSTRIRHLPPDDDQEAVANGKVRGVTWEPPNPLRLSSGVCQAALRA